MTRKRDTECTTGQTGENMRVGGIKESSMVWELI
jgi:hypothetical protein